MCLFLVFVCLNDGKRKLMVKYQTYRSQNVDTLVTLLQQEIDDLQPSVVEMKENALVKQVAKRKVFFEIQRFSTI